MHQQRLRLEHAVVRGARSAGAAWRAITSVVSSSAPPWYAMKPKRPRSSHSSTTPGIASSSANVGWSRRRSSHVRDGVSGIAGLPATRPCHAPVASAPMLVWMDLEMTGLDHTSDVIVEIATLVTDDELNIVAEGPDIVIHHPEDVLMRMDPFVVDMHTRSGLLDQIRASTVDARRGRRGRRSRSSRSTCPSRARCRCAATRSAPTAASSPPTCPRSRSTCTTGRSTCRRSRSSCAAGTPTCSPSAAGRPAPTAPSTTSARASSELQLYRELVFCTPDVVRERLGGQAAPCAAERAAREPVSRIVRAAVVTELRRARRDRRAGRRPIRSPAPTRSWCASPTARSIAPTRCSARAATPIRAVARSGDPRARVRRHRRRARRPRARRGRSATR